MFYCKKCQKKFGYPEGFSRSYGRCECCEELASCYDVPSSCLSLPKVTEKEQPDKDYLFWNQIAKALDIRLIGFTQQDSATFSSGKYETFTISGSVGNKIRKAARIK